MLQTTNISLVTARIPGVIKTAIFMVQILLAGTAQAVTCTTTSSDLPIKFPASATIPRDAVVGTLLTPWTESSMILYNCQNADRSRWTGLGGWSVMAADVSTSVAEGGVTYATFSTGLKGVSMIARWGNSGGGYLAALVSPKQKIVVSGRGGTAYATFRMRVSLALIKTGDIVAGKVNAGIFGRTGAGEANSASDAPKEDDYLLLSPVNVTYNAVNIQMGTCSTPNVVVDLGTHRRSEFTANLSTTPPVTFNVVFKSCPDSVKKISMSLSRTNESIFTKGSGLFELDDQSTAGGVILKVMDVSGVPMTFDKFYPLIGYDGTGGNVNFSLKAAMVKFGDVTGGKVKGTLRFNILYE